MTYGREKRQMLAWMALLAPLPLPFNQALEWPVLFVYALLLVYFVQRTEHGRPIVLPNWVLNVLGLVYLPLLGFDLWAAVIRSRPVTALLHLIMFLIVVKLYSMRREKDKWHLMIASFFLFVSGMATSTHLTVGFYLLGFMVLTLLILARFAFLHMLSAGRRPAIDAEGEGRQRARSGDAEAPPKLRKVPYRAPLVAGTALVVAIAIPTFATMPRLREPLFLGPGGGSGGLIRTTGFSDSVDLSLTSSIRGNRNVVLRLKYSDGAPEGEEMRFKGATFDRYENGRWHRMLQHATILSPMMDESKGRIFRLARGEVAGSVEIFRERMNSQSLILPMESVGVAISQPIVNLDLGGAAFLAGVPLDTIRYEAHLTSEPRIAAQLARLDSQEVSPLTALDQGGVTDRMRELARVVMGEGTPEERAGRLERHLLSEYAYTLDFVGRDGENPLEDFLFTYKSGHCEYFASSMVLMLRAENIPARLSTGFLGAEYNPLEGYYMVRQDNAHAWVEAFTPSRGWQVYDPTPPEGRPVLPPRSFRQLMSQLYDYMTFRWDRYVLTYGAEDQRDFFQKVRERMSELWRQLTGWSAGQGSTDGQENRGGVESSNETVVREPDLWLNKLPLGIAASLFALALAALIVWRHRQPLTGELAYRKLRQALEHSGLAVSDALAPLELRDLAVLHYPSAQPPTRRLVGHYLRESFAEEPLDASERAHLKDDLRAVSEAIRREHRERKRARYRPLGGNEGGRTGSNR